MRGAARAGQGRSRRTTSAGSGVRATTTMRVAVVGEDGAVGAGTARARGRSRRRVPASVARAEPALAGLGRSRRAGARPPAREARRRRASPRISRRPARHFASSAARKAEQVRRAAPSRPRAPPRARACGVGGEDPHDDADPARQLPCGAAHVPGTPASAPSRRGASALGVVRRARAASDRDVVVAPSRPRALGPAPGRARASNVSTHSSRPSPHDVGSQPDAARMRSARRRRAARARRSRRPTNIAAWRRVDPRCPARARFRLRDQQLGHVLDVRPRRRPRTRMSCVAPRRPIRYDLRRRLASSGARGRRPRPSSPSRGRSPAKTPAGRVLDVDEGHAAVAGVEVDAARSSAAGSAAAGWPGPSGRRRSRGEAQVEQAVAEDGASRRRQPDRTATPWRSCSNTAAAPSCAVRSVKSDGRSGRTTRDVGAHPLEVGADVRREVDLVDHEQVGLEHAEAALARDVVAGRGVDHVDPVVDEVGA